MINLEEHASMVAVAGLLEGMGVPWPGAVVVAAAGVAAGGSWPDLLHLTALFGVAYSLGALCQYMLGRLAGSRALAFMPRRFRQQVESLMKRHGESAVLFSRPLVIGNYISVPAGMMRMPLTRFLTATFLGISPWALGMLAAGDMVGGYVAGAQELMARYLVPGAVALAAVTLLPLLWKQVRRAKSGLAA